MTSWKIGQKLVCVESHHVAETSLGRMLTGYVKNQDQGWVTIACPTARLIVSRYQEQFEKDGWQLEFVAMRSRPSMLS
ncbi:MAG: hypothetical protein NW220_15595 [Leptolyngbyaceae cyanobacterium bins.349]|nr:hypothetical protein [Leptolyngbyaceae cyanobacterium bins.349]